MSQKSGSLLSWLAFYCPDKSQFVNFQSRTRGTKPCPPQLSPCWEFGSAEDWDRWVGLTLLNQCYNTGSYLSELPLLLPLFLGFFPEVSFSCRTSLVREPDAKKYLISPYFNIIFCLIINEIDSNKFQSRST